MFTFRTVWLRAGAVEGIKVPLFTILHEGESTVMFDVRREPFLIICTIKTSVMRIGCNRKCLG